MNYSLNLFAVCTLLWTCTAFNANGQTAPGGVGDLSGTSVLRLWVSSQSTNVTANNAPVDSLFDLSGAGNHLYAPSEAARPVLLTNQINGYPVINFDGAQQYLLDPLADTTFRHKEATLIVVASQDVQGAILSISDAGSNDEFLILNNVVFHHSSPFNWSALDHPCKLTDTVSDFVIMTGVLGVTVEDIQNHYFQVSSSWNAIIDGSPSAFNIVDRSVHIGQRDVMISAEWLAGDLVEVIAYNRKLNPVELNSVISYLENKYQIVEHCTSVGIEEHDLWSELIIYPNPSTGRFMISIADSSEHVSIDVFNSLGESIYREQTYNLSTIEVDLKNVSKGLYFVRVVYNEETYSRMIVVDPD